MNSAPPANIAGYKRIKRLFDIASGAVLMGFLAVPVIIIAVWIKKTSPGPLIYWSFRVGARNRLFRMPKFRTMRIDTPPVATHLLQSPGDYVTKIGTVLRKTSLDELPQIYSVLNGDMSFVGPRPALFNQDDLIALRTEKEIHEIVPGITGWAQVNGRDELPIPVKVAYDEFYLKHRSLIFDLKIMLLTLAKTLKREGVDH
jgi:O-antigen biosynthesis protein WbqP